MSESVILYVSDWNLQDKFYRVPIDLLKEFKSLIEKNGIKKAWDWFSGLTAYKGRSTKEEPIKQLSRIPADSSNGDYFLDYTNPKESVDEWEFESVDEWDES